MLVHIGLSLFSYATLIIAALYAMQLAWIDYQLKNKKLAFNHEMPPLMVIERKMFHITQSRCGSADADAVHGLVLYEEPVQRGEYR